MIELRLPVPPSANHLFLNVRGVGRIKTDEYKSWIAHAGLLINSQNVGTVMGRISVTMVIPRNRRRDIDNHIKPLLDLLRRMGVTEDDRNVEELTARYEEREDVLVKVEPYQWVEVHIHD